MDVRSGDFRGRRVVVTGAAGVHGRWIAEAFAREGAGLLLIDFREEPLREVAGSLDSGAAEVSTHVCDLRDPSETARIGELVGRTWGAADVLVNNAGVYPHKAFLDTSLADWNAVMDLNLTAPFLLTRDLARQMIEQEVRGSIVNMSSGAANRSGPGSLPYATSKAALTTLTRASALELAPYGIRVNAVSPGFAPGSEVSHLDDAYVANMVRSIPLGRTSGAGDASQAVLFLCSEGASFITGTTIVCDGGRSAGSFSAPGGR